MQRNSISVLDQTDLKILDILQQETRLDVRQIAFRVHKSPPAAHERILKLQEKGFIQRYIAILVRGLMGRPTLMITLVKLKEHAASILRDFSTTMNSLPNMIFCCRLP